MADTMTGACNCGAVTYAVKSESVLTYVCHCGNCQKRSGSAFGMGMFIPVDDLTVEGDLTCWERISDTGRTNPRYSCATCGNVIYGLGDYTPGFAKLMPGTLQDTRDIRPDVHIWVGSAQGWVTVPEDVLQYDEQPTDIDELLRLVAENRAKAAEKAT
ncbi:MAG: GFA family protein [Rhodospirillaceae bacterium]|nr:GFA family protein [Rhodospirillaceae bacterium]MDD9918954.1 GFA family protein [Rhodospirillaceae bacterium]